MKLLTLQIRLLISVSVLIGCNSSRNGAETSESSASAPQAVYGKRLPADVVMFRNDIKSWEATTRIRVSEPATHAMEKDWLALEPKLAEASKPVLTRAYLYELRDTKGLSQRETAVVSLDDVTGFPLYSFAAMSGYGRDTGFLRCVSVPQGGAISIDGAAKGVTIKEFVLNVGLHKIEIALPGKKCEEHVTIEKNKFKESRCQ